MRRRTRATIAPNVPNVPTSRPDTTRATIAPKDATRRTGKKSQKNAKNASTPKTVFSGVVANSPPRMASTPNLDGKRRTRAPKDGRLTVSDFRMASTAKGGRHAESDLQTACVGWFRMQYAKYARRLFAIPNGGHRHMATARRLRREGVLAGVPDLLLAVRRYHYGGLWIEMKFGKTGRLTPSQKEMHEELSIDYLVKVARSFDEFRQIINNYLD